MRNLMPSHTAWRWKGFYMFGLAMLLGLVVLVTTLTANNASLADGAHKKRILLIGASVGKDWHLQGFPSRAKLDDFAFESIAAYQYDKTEALEEVLMRPERKFHPTRSYVVGFFKPPPQLPNVIILKECAAYFPGDLHHYKELVGAWVQRIRQSHLQAVLATVVPITKGRAEQERDKIEAIWAYNDWLRTYARQEQVPLLDLEVAVQQDASNRYLKEDLDGGDGLHLNKKAYTLLDRLLQESLFPQISFSKGVD
jgi:hypothetical protein